MLLKLVIVAVALWAGAFASNKFARGTLASNRENEWPENQKSSELSSAEFHWTVVHVRDDIGGIHSMLVITNGLLAGLLAALCYSGF
jgi:hypothetical protein